MAVAQPKPKYTVDDLWELSHRTGKRYELVRGELRELAPASAEHGFVSARLITLVANHVRAKGLGAVFASETGFVLADEPPVVRAPDLAYVSNQRLPEGGMPRHFARFVPDLVAEVVSPGDSFSAVMEKVQDWLRAGVQVVWVVEPAERQVTVCRSGSPWRTLREGDTLSGEEVLAGFACPVSEIFAL